MVDSGQALRNVESGFDNSIRNYFVTGTAIVLPLLLTVFLFLVVVDLLSGVLNPLVIPIQAVLGLTSPLFSQTIATVVLLLSILVVGALAEGPVGGDRLKQGLDSTIARIPGIRSIYGPLDQMSSTLLEGDTRNFQDVVLVEFPKAGSYTVAFQTSHPPEMIEAATEVDDMLTVFVPMGPNPFMGGFILHLGEDEVYDLDLSVEEGISSVISFGVAVEIDEQPPDFPVDLNTVEQVRP